MKGLKLSLLGLGILLMGCAFVISEKYVLFSPVAKWSPAWRGFW